MTYYLIQIWKWCREVFFNLLSKLLTWSSGSSFCFGIIFRLDRWHSIVQFCKICGRLDLESWEECLIWWKIVFVFSIQYVFINIIRYFLLLLSSMGLFCTLFGYSACSSFSFSLFLWSSQRNVKNEIFLASYRMQKSCKLKSFYFCVNFILLCTPLIQKINLSNIRNYINDIICRLYVSH